MTDTQLAELTTAAGPDDKYRAGLPATMKMSPGLAIFFNDALYERCKQIAGHMAKAEGMTPRHLIGKPEACFAVIERSITWNLSPTMVANATYQTPGGSIGYMGSLVQAILESSGRLEGGVSFKHEGDWSRVQGKFKRQQSPKGTTYVVPTWTEADAAGLYIVVSAKLRGEPEPRTLRVDLNEAFPLNSPLWATAPNRQICYLGVRAFANLAVPSLLYGVPFDFDPVGFYGEPLEDITPPRPKRQNAFERPAPVAATPNDTDESLPEPGPASDEPQLPQEAKPPTDAPEGETGGTATSPLPLDPTFYSARTADLAQCTTVSAVSDLRSLVDRELAGHSDLLKEWEKACDARTKAVLGATAPRRPGKR